MTHANVTVLFIHVHSMIYQRRPNSLGWDKTVFTSRFIESFSKGLSKIRLARQILFSNAYVNGIGRRPGVERIEGAAYRGGILRGSFKSCQLNDGVNFVSLFARTANFLQLLRPGAALVPL